MGGTQKKSCFRLLLIEENRKGKKETSSLTLPDAPVQFCTSVSTLNQRIAVATRFQLLNSTREYSLEFPRNTCRGFVESGRLCASRLTNTNGTQATADTVTLLVSMSQWSGHALGFLVLWTPSWFASVSLLGECSKRIHTEWILSFAPSCLTVFCPNQKGCLINTFWIN